VAIVLFLAVAGLEVDLGRLLAQLRVAASVGVGGVVVPFALGFGGAWLWPAALGAEAGTPAFAFALFIGTALAISALPVIVKTLVDLDLYRSDFGALVVGAAVFNDLCGWTLFGLVIGLFGHGALTAGGALREVAILFALVAAALTAGRRLALRALAWLDARGDRGGVVAFCAAFASAGLTERLGHGALPGAFLSGAEVSRTFQDPDVRQRVAAARSFEELRRALRAPVRGEEH
jgi:Kef-type K+ transport system membrane component KefB